MNHCIVTGNLGNDPKSFFTPDGYPIASFDIAIRSGKDKTSWLKIATFDKLAELAMKHLHKGARIGVVGRLDQNKWTGDDGQQRSSYRLLANQIEFIKTDGRGFDQSQQSEDVSAPPDNDVPF